MKLKAINSLTGIKVKNLNLFAIIQEVSKVFCK